MSIKLALIECFVLTILYLLFTVIYNPEHIATTFRFVVYLIVPVGNKYLQIKCPVFPQLLLDSVKCAQTSCARVLRCQTFVFVFGVTRMFPNMGQVLKNVYPIGKCSAGWGPKLILILLLYAINSIVGQSYCGYITEM